MAEKKDKGEFEDEEGMVDVFDYDPEFHHMEEDLALEHIKKENPTLYALMKKHGAEVDEESANEDAVKKD